MNTPETAHGGVAVPGGYAPPGGYLWDPWFVWDRDLLHMFYLYQQAPEGFARTADFARDRPVIAHATWSAATGWQEQPIAINYTGTAYDAARIHTGCVVRIGTTWHMLYSGSNRYVCLATSPDLQTWQKSPANPLLAPDPRLYGPHWRDPWVRRDAADAHYMMLLAAQTPGAGESASGQVAVARSADLLHWAQQEPLDIPPWFTWLEVPELHRVGARWHLLFATRDRWITPEGRRAFAAHGISTHDGAFTLRADHWRGPYRQIAPVFSAADRRYTTRLITSPDGGWRLWSHIERGSAGEPLFALAAPQAAAVLPDGRLEDGGHVAALEQGARDGKAHTGSRRPKRSRAGSDVLRSLMKGGSSP